MSWIQQLFRKSRRRIQIDKELRFHLELQIKDYVAAGMSVQEAKRRAGLEFGGIDRVKAEIRDTRKVNLIEDLVRDVVYGLRTLRKSPGFTSVAILMLALGIGANTAIFSMVNGILLRELPYARPGQLYAIHEFVPQYASYGPSLPVNGGNFLAWQKDSRAFSAMTLIDSADVALLGLGRPQWLYGAAVTPEFFAILGVNPELGRFFQKQEALSPGANEIVLTQQLWRDQFHSDPHIPGKVVSLDGRAVTIVGVLPANFIFPHVLVHDPQYFAPFPWTTWNSRPGISSHNYFVIARLKEGVIPREAEAELDGIESRIAQNDRGGKFSLYATLTPLKTSIVGSTQKTLWMLTIVAGLVLFIVCANLANLLLVKHSKRAREVVLRSIFGAGHWRLVRQFLTETLLLASAGACLGLVIAEGGLRLLVRNAPIGIPRVDQIRLDSNVLWFTLAVTVFSAAIFGLVPALRTTRVEFAETLKASGPTITAGKSGTRLRAGLVIGEIAVCAALLPGCLLLIRSLRHVVLANQWMNEEQVITAELLVPERATQPETKEDFLRAFEERDRIFTSIQQKVEQLPGVKAAGFTSGVPLEGTKWGDDLTFREISLSESERPSGEFRFISPGYFQAIGLPSVEGRTFMPGDLGQSVAVISESIARRVLAGRNPLGMEIDCSDFAFGPRKWCRIIGVVDDIRNSSDDAPVLAAYFPLWLYSSPSETLVVRTMMDPTSAAGAIREAIWSVDPDLAVPNERTLKTITGDAEAPRRYETWLAALFALCAALLAMLGLSAVISFSVSQRSHEIGIRMALGAQPADVLGVVIREAMLLAGVGISLGIAVALAMMRFLQSLLFEIKPTDPATFACVAFSLAAVALLAGYIPARRAMRVDPMVALRHE